MEWDTPPRVGQRPRTAQIPSVSGRLTSYQLAMAFDTPPKSGRAPTGISFQKRRPVGRSVFIPSPTKGITRCEQQTLPKTANTTPAHAPETIQSVLAHQSIDSYSWEASTVLYSAAPLTTGSTARRFPVVFLSPEKHRALTLRDLAPSSYGVGHSATRGPTPPHGTNPVSLRKTGKLRISHGV